MGKLPIGLVLRQIFDEGNVSATQLVDVLKKSKQSVYNDFKRTDMNSADLARWSEALGVSIDEIQSRWNNQTSSIEKPVENSGVYLQQHLSNLEEQFKTLAEQLRVKDKQMEVQLAMKDKQIDGLQRTVDVLLGKSKPVTDEGKVIEMYSKEVA